MPNSMLSIAIVIFREVLEISLIVGVLLAATRGLPKRTPWVWMGMLAGLIGACVMAIFADVISAAFEGVGQEVMNAAILFIAASLIAWTVLWMSKHGRELTQHFKQVGQEVKAKHKPMYTLAVVVGLAVLREGAEIVMFIYSAVVTGGKVYQLAIGSILGGLAGIAVGTAMYYGLVKIPTKKIFTVTSWLLILLVAGMVASAFGYLAAAGKVPELIPMVWDTSWIVSEQSVLGKVMHVLVGYSERPSGIKLLTFILTIGGLAVALRIYGDGNTKNIKKAVMMLAVGMTCLMSLPQEAHALKKVYSPVVEKGEVEIEAQGTYDYDHKRKDKNEIQKQEYSLGYGVNDWWFTELAGEVEKERNDIGEDLNFRFTEMESENIFQFTPQGKYWIDAGGYLAYEQSFEDKHASELKWKLLLEKNMTSLTHTANFGFAKEVGAGNGSKQYEGDFAWRTKYRLSEQFQPGVEYYAGFGSLTRHHNTYNDQTHQVGPVFYGRLANHIRYDVGYLFGISPAAPLGELKWVLEYELRF